MPFWVPIAAWPLLVLLALGGGAIGGATAVTAAVLAVAIGAVLVYAAS